MTLIEDLLNAGGPNSWQRQAAVAKELVNFYNWPGIADPYYLRVNKETVYTAGPAWVEAGRLLTLRLNPANFGAGVVESAMNQEAYHAAIGGTNGGTVATMSGMWKLAAIAIAAVLLARR